jgi:hypothetical protein
MMGDIINPEIMGLHEAFADYFALTTIGSSDIGRVMVSGKAIRSAAEILQYSPGMEVHDLGNVVLSGLWNIRNLIEDKDLADQVAFETIRDLSTNPYTAAGDVTAAHRRALEKIASTKIPTPLSSDSQIEKDNNEHMKMSSTYSSYNKTVDEIMSSKLNQHFAFVEKVHNDDDDDEKLDPLSINYDPSYTNLKKSKLKAVKVRAMNYNLTSLI